MKGLLVALGAFFAGLALLLAVAFTALHFYFQHQETGEHERLVAVSWGDTSWADDLRGKGFYGAYVYYEPTDDGQLAVKLSVRIGRCDAVTCYSHNPRPLGTVKTPEDAVARWGHITWSDAGLTVGSATGVGYLFPRAELERHR